MVAGDGSGFSCRGKSTETRRERIIHEEEKGKAHFLMLSLIPCLTGTTEKAGSSLITITWEEKDAPPFFWQGRGREGDGKRRKKQKTSLYTKWRSRWACGGQCGIVDRAWPV